MNQHKSTRPGARDLGIAIGNLPPGDLNAITDVPGVAVGQTTVSFGDGPLRPGEGPARTGVTVILPHADNLYLDRVPAAVHVFNGFGKCMGLEQVEELGVLETPITLTSTLCVGRVADALVSHAIRENPGVGLTLPTVNPFVGECSDAFLNDIQGRHVREEHVLAAIDSAVGGTVAQGSVGAGTGMSAFGFKGGIGTSSRRLSVALGGWTVGALVLSNFGKREDLIVNGIPVGRRLSEASERTEERGSIMMIVATNAPMNDRQLKRLARRAVLGLARTGARGGHGSGDVVVAFSNAESARIPYSAATTTIQMEILAEQGPNGSSTVIDALFTAVADATEEAILNSLFHATTVTGRSGNCREAIPIASVIEILRQSGWSPTVT